MKFFGINIPEHILTKAYVPSLSDEISVSETIFKKEFVGGNKFNSCDTCKVWPNCDQCKDTMKLVVSIKDRNEAVFKDGWYQQIPIKRTTLFTCDKCLCHKVCKSSDDGDIVSAPDGYKHLPFKYVTGVTEKHELPCSTELQAYLSTVENSVEKIMSSNLYKINCSDKFKVMYQEFYQKSFSTMDEFNDFIKPTFLDLFCYAVNTKQIYGLKIGGTPYHAESCEDYGNFIQVVIKYKVFVIKENGDVVEL
jgi:hypothetical protein